MVLNKFLCMKYFFIWHKCNTLQLHLIKHFFKGNNILTFTSSSTITYSLPCPTLAFTCSPFHVKPGATCGTDNLLHAYDNIWSLSASIWIPVPVSSAFRLAFIVVSSSHEPILIIPSSTMFSFLKLVGKDIFLKNTTLYVLETNFPTAFFIFFELLLKGGKVTGGTAKVLATCVANDGLFNICRALSETEINQTYFSYMYMYIKFKVQSRCLGEVTLKTRCVCETLCYWRQQSPKELFLAQRSQ